MQVNEEVKTLNDIIFVNESTNYTTILIKTFYVFQYAVWHYNANFIIKTDDDAFINVPATIAMLKVRAVPPTPCTAIATGPVHVAHMHQRAPLHWHHGPRRPSAHGPRASVEQH